MISLHVPLKDYENCSEEEKAQVFEELTNRILIAHPEYLGIVKNTTMQELCLDIMDETKDSHLITKVEDRKIKKLVKKCFR